MDFIVKSISNWLNQPQFKYSNKPVRVKETAMSMIKGMTNCYLTVSSTTGRKKLLPDDVRIPVGYNIKELTRLGTKTVFDQKALRPFENTRKTAQTFLDMIGVRHAGGWAVPDSRLPEVDKKMKEFDKIFIGHKSKLLSNYEETLNQWLSEVENINSALAHIIRENVISKDYLQNQITFHFYREEDEAKNVVSTLVSETAIAASKAIDKLVGKGTVTKLDRRSLAYITNIRDKLDSMVFLNPSIQPTVDRINGFISSIPKRETLGIEWYQSLIKELAFLSDENNYRIIQHQQDVEVDEDVVNVIKADEEIQRAVTQSSENFVWDVDVAFEDIDQSLLESEVVAESLTTSTEVVDDNAGWF